MTKWLKPCVAGIAIALAAAGALAQNVRTIKLPVELRFPEGIGIDAAGSLFTAGAFDGTIVRTDLAGKRSTILVKAGASLPTGSATYPRFLGLKVDGVGRLWIMGGRTGKLLVIDARTGRLLKELSVPVEGSLLNDAVITSNAVYITDTLRPTLWRIALDEKDIGKLEAWIDFRGTPIEYGEGRNLNGITRSPDGASLIVVQMDKGRLFKIDAATRKITPIDIGPEVITGADGLELDGTTLYLVRQPEGEVVTLRLAPDLGSGKVVSRFKDPTLRRPATALKVGKELLVVNTQFDKRTSNDPVVPFTITAIPIAALTAQ